MTVWEHKSHLSRSQGNSRYGHDPIFKRSKPRVLQSNLEESLQKMIKRRLLEREGVADRARISVPSVTNALANRLMERFWISTFGQTLSRSDVFHLFRSSRRLIYTTYLHLTYPPPNSTLPSPFISRLGSRKVTCPRLGKRFKPVEQLEDGSARTSNLKKGLKEGV